MFDWQYIGKIIDGYFAKFCGLLRIYELYAKAAAMLNYHFVNLFSKWARAFPA